MRITNKIYVAFTSLLVAVSAIVALNVIATDAQAVSSYRNCNDDAIIRCGAITEAELLQKYGANTGDIQSVLSKYGISRSDLAGTTSQIKHGTVYQDGRVVVDGKTVATDAYSLSRVRFSNASRAVTINGKTYYEGPNMGIFVRAVDAYVYMRNGQFYRAVLSACGNPIVAKPVKPPVLPTYTCDSLKAVKIDRTKFTFTAAATAKNGAEIVNYTYDFGDSDTQTVTGTSVTHTYDKPGNYTITVTANVRVNGVIKPVTSDKCKVTIKVQPVPIKPLYVCNSLTAQIVTVETRTYEYALTYTAEGGATLEKVVYDFGDSTSQTYDDAAQAAKVQHSYAKAGSYKTTATLYFSVNDGTEIVEKSLTCEVSINIAPENCIVPGKENLPKNSPDCVETPPELPKTGIGGMLSGGLGLGSLTAAGYYWVSSRKSMLNALIKR